MAVNKKKRARQTPALKEYAIPCTWEIAGNVIVNAHSLAEAIALAQAAPLPPGEYVPDSFQVNRDAARDTYADKTTQGDGQ